jgi:uncharacterized protein (TIGR02246 family)
MYKLRPQQGAVCFDFMRNWRMSQKVNGVVVLSLTAAVFAAMSHAATSTAVEDEIRKRDAEWEVAIKTADAEKVAAFYTDDAYALANHRPIAVGHKAIVGEWQLVFARPHFQIHWKPIYIEVAESKEIAYDVGSYTASMTDPSGKALDLTGKYLVVWKKGADGKWRVAADISNPNT